jgi:hypothetical protein
LQGVTCVGASIAAGVGATLAVLAGGSVLASPAATAAQFITGHEVGADLVVEAGGGAYLVSPSAPQNARARPSARVWAAAPGATFGPARLLLRSTRSDRVVDTGIASGGSGVIVVQRVAGRRRAVRLVRFDRGARLGRSVTLSRGSRSDFAASDTADSGAVVVVWFRHRDGGRWRLEAALREPGAETFGAPRAVSDWVRRACCTAVAAAVGDRGDAVVAWSSTARPGVRAALRRAGGGFARARLLAGDASGAAATAVGADGTAVVLYGRQRVLGREHEGLWLHRAVGPRGDLGAAERLATGAPVTVAAATVTPAGRVLVGWIDEAAERVHLAEAGPGEPFGDSGPLGRRVTGEAVVVAGDDAGRAVLAWSERLGGRVLRQRAVASVRPAGQAAFGAAQDLGLPWRAAEARSARLLPSAGALVLWKGARYRGPGGRRAVLLATRVRG